MEKQFIPGIFSYCDRWCERCPLSHRCEVYVSEQQMTAAQRDPDSPAFWAFIQENYQKVLLMMEAIAKKDGIDLEAIRKSGTLSPKEMPPERKALENLGHDYVLRTLNWLQAYRPAFQKRSEEYLQEHELGLDRWAMMRQLKDAYETIQWYSTMIGDKTRHALKGYDEQDAWYVEDPLQSDANGTAKVALICIERSLGAWEAVRTHLPDFSDEIIDFLVLLEKVRRGLLSYFPDNDKFVRPGFDELEGA
jgi:hypothetical protein